MERFSFAETRLYVNGVEMQAYDAGDDVISIARSTDSGQHVMTADGKMVFSQNTDRSGTFTFRLNQASDSNAFMSGLVAAQENNIAAPLIVMFKDLQGSDLAMGTEGYILRPADMGRGVNTNSQEWVCVVEQLTMVHGGA